MSLMNFLPKKILFLLLVLIFILVIILVLKTNLQKPTPIPKDQGSPTPSVPTTSFTQTTSFTVSSTSNLNNPLGPFDQIELVFSQEINKQGTLLKIEPDTPITLNVSGNRLLISPLWQWDFGVEYKLTILRESTSLEEKELDKDYTYIFRVVPYHGE